MNAKNDMQTTAVIRQDSLQKLIDILSKQGYRVIAPTVRDNAIVLDEVTSISELPIGITDKQDGGYYRLMPGESGSLFGYVVGPQSWKKFLYPPVQKLWEAKKTKNGFELIENQAEPPGLAFLGVRPCDLAAIKIHDKVLTEGPYADPGYIKNRRDSLIIVVNCTNPGSTCFCASMGTGPKAESGYDLAITELFRDNKHDFLIESGSPVGEELLQKITHHKADDNYLQAAEEVLQSASQRMGRKLNNRDVQSLLARNFESFHWEEIARRCLTCGNCTMVCPTCFCTTIEDRTDLAGEIATHVRKWDSCFTMDFSYIFGGSIRQSGMSRYRQWMTHKLSNWVDQFGMPGCVGCGRCITWCPVGIDITEEARYFEQSEQAVNASNIEKDVSDGKS